MKMRKRRTIKILLFAGLLKAAMILFNNLATKLPIKGKTDFLVFLIPVTQTVFYNIKILPNIYL